MPTPELELKTIALNKIDSNPWQPRSNPDPEDFAALIESIRARGQATPIHIRKHPTKIGRFQIIDGALRVAALRRLRKKTVLAVVADKVTDEEMPISAYAQNTWVKMSGLDREKYVQRQYAKFVSERQVEQKHREDRFPGVTEFAKLLGVPRQTVTRYLETSVARAELAPPGPTRDKATHAAVKTVSPYDLQELAPFVKNSKEAVLALIIARQKDSLTGDQLRETAKTLTGNPRDDKARVAAALKTLKAREKQEVLRRTEVEDTIQEENTKERRVRQSAEVNWREAQAEEERLARIQANEEHITQEKVLMRSVKGGTDANEDLKRVLQRIETAHENILDNTVRLDAIHNLAIAALKEVIMLLEEKAPALAKSLKETNRMVEQ